MEVNHVQADSKAMSTSYDGLTDREVDQALSAPFKRIEYMMFVGTRKTGTTDAANSNVQGEAETESSGCSE